MSLLRSFFKKKLKLEKGDKASGRYTLADYDETFAVPKKLLSFVGIEMAHGLSEIHAKYWNYIFMFALMNVFLETIGEFLGIAASALTSKNFRDAIEVFRTVPCFSLDLAAIIKCMKIKNNRNTFESLHRTLREMWPTGVVSEEERSIITRISKQINFIVNAYYWCNNALLIAFVVPPLFTYVSRYLGYDAPMTFAFDYWLPFNKFQPGVLELILLIQTYAVVWFIISWDMLFCVYISHITMQFELLSLRVRRLVHVPVDQQLIDSFVIVKNSKENIGEDYYFVHEIKQQENLADIIKTHQTLIRVSEGLKSMFGFGLLINMMNSSMIICFCGFCSVMIEKWNEFAYKSFFVTGLVQTWLLCWYGQKLLDHSLSLSQALYECGWYNGSKKTKKSILYMLLRAQRGVHATTYGFSIVSLSSYTTIIKTSWSFFTLLCNFYLEDNSG